MIPHRDIRIMFCRLKLPPFSTAEKEILVKYLQCIVWHSLVQHVHFKSCKHLITPLFWVHVCVSIILDLSIFLRLRSTTSPTCIKQAPKGQSKYACLRQVLA